MLLSAQHTHSFTNLDLDGIVPLVCPCPCRGEQTFVQVLSGKVVAENVPPGHGHDRSNDE